jgi:hypothetical protein
MWAPLTILGFLLGGSPALGAGSPDLSEIDIRLEVRSRSAGALEGHLRLIPTTGEGEAALQLSVANKSKVRAELPRGTSWQVVAEIDGHWTRNRLLTTPAEGRSSLTLDLWPTGRIAGSVRLEGEEDLPEEIMVRFSSPRTPKFVGRGASRQSDPPEIPLSLLECPVDERGQWSCELPATPLDLALRAESYVSHYRWGVVVPRDKTLRIGTLDLERGASLVGTAGVAEGVLVPDRCQARLVPRVAPGGDRALARRIAETAVTAAVDRRGFFHFRGVAPGSYLLEIVQPGYAPARRFPIEVWPDAETSLRDPLILRRPLKLELTLAPPRDWLDQPWQVRIFRASDANAAFEDDPVYHDTADPEGRVVIDGQGPGTFLVTVADSRGNPVYSRHDLAVTGPDEARQRIEIDLVDLRGVLTLGEEPLSGTIWFGGRHGAVHVRMEADGKGEFHGILPRDGSWRVEVEAAEPEVRTETQVTVDADRRGEAEVELRLPDTEVFGRVVDGSAVPVVEARVNARTVNGSFQTRTDEQGEFELRGFDSGPLELSATASTEDGPLTGESVLFPVSEGSPLGPIELQLRETERIRGEVWSHRGPIVGGTVVVFPLHPNNLAFTDRVRTDLEGRFEARIPRGTETLQVVVSPPGHALRALSLDAGELPARIEVPAEGGVLEVAIPEGEEAQRGIEMLVFQDGLTIPFAQLYDWARGHGAPWGQGGIVQIPRLAPGEYQVCLARQVEMARAGLEEAHWRAGLSEDRCASGYLAIGATLRLDLSGS